MPMLPQQFHYSIYYALTRLKETPEAWEENWHLFFSIKVLGIIFIKCAIYILVVAHMKNNYNSHC